MAVAGRLLGRTLPPRPQQVGIDQLVPKVSLRNLQWIENEVILPLRCQH